MEFTGIDKMSLLDYEDYVSVVLFTPKCNYRCPFCHNGKSVLESNAIIDFDDILSYLKSRKGLIDAVVITGGEPTLMPELKERIIKIRELGLRVKLDTNGSNPDVLKDLVNSNLIDYVAMDIKNSLKEYPSTCGVNKVDENKLKEIVLDLVKYKGPLFIYMGQEYGVKHRPNLFEKDPVNWEPNNKVLEIYKEAIKIKKSQ